jgi:hypothetical protein
MRLIYFIFIVLVPLLAASSLQAGPLKNDQGLMRFDTFDARLIRRNRLLRDLVAIDPWLVRTIIDLSQSQRNNHPVDGVDPVQNPDLVGPDQTMSVKTEWSDLLSHAQDELQGAARASRPRTRSPEGSLEFLDMLKKAKEAKDRAPK